MDYPLAVIVLGDQLSMSCGAFDGLDPTQTVVIMSERISESTRPLSTKSRVAFFIASMRRFAKKLRTQGWRVRYRTLDEPGASTLWDDLALLAHQEGARHARAVEPGEHALIDSMEGAFHHQAIGLEWVEDQKFIFSTPTFSQWLGDRTSARLEHFYRWARKHTALLVDASGAPLGGHWNFDAQNRSAYPKSGPGLLPARPRFERDSDDLQALADVELFCPDCPGNLDHFDWPLDEDQARQAAEDFLDLRLADFGTFQDAMWAGELFGSHSLLAASLNVGHLDPMWLCTQAENRFKTGSAPIESVEGFVRQILGWREFVRGMYWSLMPQLKSANGMGGDLNLPSWFWGTTKTKMNCMSHAISQSLEYGYAHHIQRLMIIGNFCLTAGIEPRQVSDWFQGAYVDALEWVQLPNVLGMALHADGGSLSSKPYMAGGAYVSKQSNYCKSCCYDPQKRTGEQSCPLSALYWGAVDRHSAMLAANPRTAMPVKSWQGFIASDQQAVRQRVEWIRSHLDSI